MQSGDATTGCAPAATRAAGAPPAAAFPRPVGADASITARRILRPKGSGASTAGAPGNPSVSCACRIGCGTVAPATVVEGPRRYPRSPRRNVGIRDSGFGIRGGGLRPARRRFSNPESRFPNPGSRRYAAGLPRQTKNREPGANNQLTESPGPHGSGLSSSVRQIKGLPDQWRVQPHLGKSGSKVMRSITHS